MQDLHQTAHTGHLMSIFTRSQTFINRNMFFSEKYLVLTYNAYDDVKHAYMTILTHIVHKHFHPCLRAICTTSTLKSRFFCLYLQTRRINMCILHFITTSYSVSKLPCDFSLANLALFPDPFESALCLQQLFAMKKQTIPLENREEPLEGEAPGFYMWFGNGGGVLRSFFCKIAVRSPKSSLCHIYGRLTLKRCRK